MRRVTRGRVIDEVRVEVPFTTTIGGVECAGTVDAIGFDAVQESRSLMRTRTVIVEHKTTSSDISPGSSYWRQVSATDLQVSMYAAAFPGATILYDVIRKPDITHFHVPLLDDRGLPIVLDCHGSRVYKTTGDKGPRKTGDKDKGYVLQTRPETDDELVARCLDAMAEDPERYFQRQVIVRLEHEHAAFARDIYEIDQLRRNVYPRNPSSCHSFGRQCGYFTTCWGSDTIDNDALFTHNTHGESTSEVYGEGSEGP